MRVTNVPTVKAPTMDAVLTTGICVMPNCRKPIAAHLNPETGAWEGCERAATVTETPQMGAHPLRREDDVVIMVPVTILQQRAPEGDRILNEDEVPKTRTRRHGTFREAAEARVRNRQTDVRRARRTKTKAGPGRGKQPGRYVVTGKEPSNMTQRVNGIYFALKRNAKRGLSARKLSDRLKIPAGTVAWALTQLQKQGAIKHVPPGKHARSVQPKTAAAA